jgi:hypothetical protein
MRRPPQELPQKSEDKEPWQFRPPSLIPFGLRGVEIGPKIWTKDLSFIPSQFSIIGTPQGRIVEQIG